jgi:hypothetical protein
VEDAVFKCGLDEGDFDGAGEGGLEAGGFEVDDGEGVGCEASVVVEELARSHGGGFDWVGLILIMGAVCWVVWIFWRVVFMFKVMAPKFSREFELWTEALEQGKALMPGCGFFDEVRILEKGELVWMYKRGYKYPQFVGPGTYDRLARRFVLEITAQGPENLEENVELSEDKGEGD